MEEKLIKIEVNLQQSIIWIGKEDVSNGICAITHRFRKLVVIRPEYRQIQDEILALVDFKKPNVFYGDSFSVDTWDRKIDQKLKLASLKEDVARKLDQNLDEDEIPFREDLVNIVADIIQEREKE